MTTEAIEGSDGRSAASDGPRIGPYRLIQQLGEGGMGVVHLALDPSGRAVALKLLRPHVAQDCDARSRLAREVAVLRRIDDHRVATVIDADLDGARPYLVTRYVPGPALDDVVKETGPIRDGNLLRLGRGLADALHAIHDADVIHRDLKPGNVLLLDGDPVLIDFGIAHMADDVRITMTGLVMGTPGYLSPEVVGGAAVTEATDWWGWAATLAFAASGAPPFGRGPMDVVLSRVSRGEADLSGVDPRLAPLLYAALSPEPHQRPDADEVVDALERYATGRPVTQALSTPRHTQPLEHRATARWERPAVAAAPVALPVEPQWSSEPQWAPEPEQDLVPWDAPEGEVSEWQAAWAGEVGEPDPRIGRPARTGTLLAMLAAVVAATAGFPVVAAAIAVLWSWAARTADRSVTSLVLRRHHRGRRRSDVPVAVVASPWHLVVGALATVVSAILPLLVGICAVFSAALATVAVVGGSPHPNSATSLAVGALVAALMAWWGPGGSGLRRGSRSIIRGVTPGKRATQVVVVLLLVAAGVLVVWSLQRAGVPLWWPMRAPAGLPGVSLTG
ncbi:serine/threonine protein kinase [Phycicoccus badiiscoriae]|uniref:Serine/threonine protein kinase n=1 Tax=Pedococcus badiiscoriae TaxID=642776 RepID=A0A852WEK5_9MICO|nr:serine/threonine-protein kinase [Pedococcus badiiscoriae]NYG07180.1 serine/threonine protein kinase [Pedococcus badiiscoriae]